MLAKSELTRLVQTETGFVADASGKKQGRGLYLCSDETCQTQFFTTRHLSKLLRRKVEEEETNELRHQVEEARATKASLNKKKEQHKATEEKRVVRIVKVKAKTDADGVLG